MSAAWLNRVLIILAWAGIFVAGFLTLSHFLKFEPPCAIGTAKCGVVLNDPRAFWFGLPVAIYGLGAYVAFTILSALRTWPNVENMALVIRLGLILAGVGTAIQLYLQYVALAQIGARCDWCIASAVIMGLTLIFHGLLSQKDVGSLPGNRLDAMVFVASAVVALGSLGIMVKKQYSGDIRVIDVALETLAPNKAYYVGPDDAPVTIVEFADFYCPSCRVRSPELREFQRKHQKTVRLVYINFPLFEKRDHMLSLPAAMVSEYAAEKGKYWEFVDMMYEGGKEGAPGTFDQIIALLGRIGLDGEEARRRVAEKDEKLLDPIYRARQVGQANGVGITPSFIIFARGQKPMLADSDSLRNILFDERVASLIGPETH